MITGQHRNGEEVQRIITGSFQVGPILGNQLSASELMLQQQRSGIKNESLDSLLEDTDSDLLDRIEGMESDPLDIFEELPD